MQCLLVSWRATVSGLQKRSIVLSVDAAASSDSIAGPASSLNEKWLSDWGNGRRLANCIILCILCWCGFWRSLWQAKKDYHGDDIYEDDDDEGSENDDDSNSDGDDDDGGHKEEPMKVRRKKSEYRK